MYTQFNFSLPINIDLRSKLKISTNVTRESHAIRRGIKPREAFRARTSRLISAANFIFGASRANDSASSVSPQCSRGGPDSDTRSQRKSIKPARKSALDRERAPCRAAITSPQLKLAFWLDETKIAVARGYTSLLKRVLQRRHFASNADLRLGCAIRVTFGLSAYQKQTVLRAEEWRSLWHWACQSGVWFRSLYFYYRKTTDILIDSLNEIWRSFFF